MYRDGVPRQDPVRWSWIDTSTGTHRLAVLHCFFFFFFFFFPPFRSLVHGALFVTRSTHLEHRKLRHPKHRSLAKLFKALGAIQAASWPEVRVDGRLDDFALVC